MGNRSSAPLPAVAQMQKRFAPEELRRLEAQCPPTTASGGDQSSGSKSGSSSGSSSRYVCLSVCVCVPFPGLLGTRAASPLCW
jgi:hypothetical protein